MRPLLALLLCLVILAPAHAQDDAPTPTPEAAATAEGDTDAALSYGLSASGSIDSATPRLVYSFDGLRGEFISLALETTGGNLDPVLLVMDSAGEVLAQRDDSGGGRDILIDSLRIPRNNRYYVVVGRFGYGFGTTSGAFDLTLERIGVSFADGSGLRYGDTVLNQITDINPRYYYTFRAERGDIISISMERTSGDLDPSLQLVDSSGIVIAENDEIEGSGNLDAAIIGQVIETEGVYVIIATRYGQVSGRSSGGFVLSLESGAQSGLGANAQFAIPLTFDTPLQGEITGDRYQQFYRFEGRQYDLISIEMSRTSSGALDSFVLLTDDQQTPLAQDDDGGGGQNSAIRNVVLPYSGVYYVVATRYQEASGVSEGEYTLTVRAGGNAFDSVPPDIQRLAYGMNIAATLDDLVPRLLFAFYGTEGDNVSISMANVTGDLDPVVGLLDSNQQLLASDDDSGGARNALIERFTLPYTGVYYIQASRYEGADRAPTAGGFILVLAQRFD
jgi:hypothetical protein